MSYRDELTAFPLDFARFWDGRITAQRSTWISDGVIAVRRAATVVSIAENMEVDVADDVASRRRSSKDGSHVAKLLALYDGAVDAEAEWFGKLKDGDAQWLAVFGTPAAPRLYYLGRLALLYAATRFERATQTERYGPGGYPLGLRVWVGDEVVGMVTHVRPEHAEIPQAIQKRIEDARR